MNRGDLDNFAVRAAVVHYIPTERDDPGDEILLTDSAIRLDAGLKRYFETRIVERLTEKGLEVVGDPNGAPTVANAVVATDSRDTSLVASSQEIARHLTTVQSTKVSPSGLLAVVSGMAGGKDCLALLKLERERGIHFAIKQVDGRNLLDLELLRDLTLTDKTRVYKTALLASENGGIGGFVADDQRGISTGRQVATFFLSRFLGCKPRLPAAQMTYQFVQAANESINEDVSSPERRGRYQVAVLAALQSTASDIRPSAFASHYLEREDREPFLARVQAAGIEPNVTFEKDTSRVKVSRFRMTFESGMVLVGDRRALDNHVALPEEQDSGEPVMLNDRVEDLLAGS
jgi:37-kD nucleoid-associated bacterial protein